VDELLGRGFAHVTALDISETALAAARRRLGSRADRVSWVVADITGFRPAQRYDLWHDRAVFHFLTEAAEREKYRQTLAHALKPGGHLIISCFSEDGPDQCSGLDVVRYTASGLASEVGTDYSLLEWFEDIHVTPSGGKQKFLFCRFQRLPGATETRRNG
jgi:SAM-dependent methyltransferase